MTTDEQQDQEMRKKAIFEAMSERGQKRVLRMGYENWDPFQEPKDPRERIFSSASLKSNEIVRQFYESREGREEAVALHKELFELCRGLLSGEARAHTIYEFCLWYRQTHGS